VHHERAEVDALAVGSETVLVDDPLLTVRGVYRDRPLTRVIFDRRVRTPPAARLFSTLDAGPVIVVTAESSDAAIRARGAALVAAGAEVECIADPSFLRAALARLASRDVMSLIVEGGPRLHEAFWRAGLVDRGELFVSPAVIGAEGVEWGALPAGSIASLVDLTARPVGDDVRIEGFVH
jgi:diaminohydroxyphosphoribosylaminopyrimidine deaminase / 5-amino-6-(5-phosphoribosylamino)uracil reductase